MADAQDMHPISGADKSISETTDPLAEQYLRLVILMRRRGASIRTIARVFGESKSKMGRRVKIIEASQMGRPDEDFADAATALDSDLSQVGQRDWIMTPA